LLPHLCEGEVGIWNRDLPPSAIRISHL